MALVPLMASRVRPRNLSTTSRKLHPSCARETWLQLARRTYSLSTRAAGFAGRCVIANFDIALQEQQG